MGKELRKETIEVLREIFEMPEGQPIIVWEIEQGTSEVYKMIMEETKNGEK